MKNMIKYLILIMIQLTVFNAFSQEEAGYEIEYDKYNSTSTEAAEAMNDYYKLKYLYEETNPLAKQSTGANEDNSNWEYFGPKEVPVPISAPIGNLSGGTIAGRSLNFVKDETTDQYYVSTGHGGLWTKLSGGNWQPLTNDYRLRDENKTLILDNNGNLWCTSVVDDIVYGLLKSTDGGQTWIAKNNGLFSTEYENLSFGPQEVIIDPNNSQIMYYITNNNVYKSTNGAELWSLAFTRSDVDDIDYFHELAIQIGNSQSLWVTGDSIMHSTDGGQTWDNETLNLLGIDDGWEIACETHPSYPDHVFFYNIGNDYIFVDYNIATNTVNRVYPTGSGQAEGTTITVSPNGYVYFADNYTHRYNISTQALERNGLTSRLSQESTYKASPSDWIHIDIRNIAVYDNNGSDEVFICSDGGLHRSVLGNTLSFPIQWEHISDDFGGLYVFDAGKMGVSQQNPEIVVAGFWDTRVIFKNETGWKYSGGGYADGSGAIINYKNDNHAIMSSIYSSEYLVNTSNGIRNSIYSTAQGSRQPAVKFHPINPNIYYSAHQSIYRPDINYFRKGGLVEHTVNYNTRSSTSTKIHENEYRVVSAIGVSKSNPNILYVGYKANGTLSNVFFKLEYDGTTWVENEITNLNGYLTGYASDIEVNPIDENELWVSFRMTSNGSDRVYHSTNGGSSWTALVNGYPSGVSANALAYDEVLGDLYVATSCGILIFDKTDNEWKSFDNCFPPVQVRDIEVQGSHRFLYASTYGRGIWRSNLNHCPNINTLNVTGTVSNDENYKATSLITSDATVTNNTKVNYVANNYGKIVLQEGFSYGGNNFRASLAKSSCTTCSSSSLYKMSASSFNNSDENYDGLESIESEGFTVSPNPSVEFITPIIEDNDFTPTKYEIINIDGRVKTIGVFEGSNLSINVSELQTAIYLLKVYNSEGKHKTVRFSKN